jgi:5'-phosphate synthase pdxT subunit
VQGIEEPVRAVFIRAPWVEQVGDGVRILAEHGGRPVVLEEGDLLAAAFHPELAGETRLHEYFLNKV